MARILSNGSGNKAAGKAAARGLIIKGLKYENTAAKFWASLVAEAIEDFPEADGLELRAPCGGLLAPELLMPEAALQENIDALDGADLRQAFHDTLAELELIGPPPPIRIALLSAAGELRRMELPLDCADADLFPFLLVWLLEWAEISEFAWNGEDVHGVVAAEDMERRWRYALRFGLQNCHLSEGLYDRTLALRFKREEIRAHPAAGRGHA